MANSLEEPITDWNNWLIEKGFVSGEPIFLNDSIQEPVAVVDKDSLKLENSIKQEEHLKAEIVKIDTVFGNDSLGYSQLALWINVNNIPPTEPEEVVEDKMTVEENDHFVDRVKKNIYNFINPSRIPKLFGSIISVLGNFMVAIMSIFFIAFFFLREEGLFTSALSAIVPNGFEDRTTSAVDQTSKMLIRYFVGVATPSFSNHSLCMDSALFIWNKKRTAYRIFCGFDECHPLHWTNYRCHFWNNHYDFIQFGHVILFRIIATVIYRCWSNRCHAAIR